jgi:hypothetical protein
MLQAVERFVFNTTDHPKRIADLLLKNEWQPDWKLSDAQEALALAYGYPTWFNLLQASRSEEPRSLFDENSPPPLVKVRHIQQARSLAVYTVAKPLGYKGTDLLPLVTNIERLLSEQPALSAAYGRHIERALALMRQITPTARARPRQASEYRGLHNGPAYLELDKMAERAAAWLSANGWEAHAASVRSYAPHPYNLTCQRRLQSVSRPPAPFN